MKRAAVWFLTGLLCGCQPSLQRQPFARPYTEGAARALPEGAVSQESKSDTNPAPTREILARGRERYDIHCSVCHGLAGEGDGMAVQRGFPAPPSFLDRPLSRAQIRKIIRDGLGRMYAMSNRINADDRAAIALYVQALQLARHFPRAALKGSP